MSPEPRAESVEQLFDIVQQVLADERTRGQGLETKTSTLAGFTGTILALTAGLGPDLLDLELGRVGQPLFHVFFVAAVVALATSAVIAVLGVLQPKEEMGLTVDQIEAFGELQLAATPPIQIQGRMMGALIIASVRQREVNQRKAFWMFGAAVSLIVGLLGVTGCALTAAFASSW
jgi:hypothetical protein